METGTTLNEYSNNTARRYAPVLDQNEADRPSSESQKEEAIKIAKAALARQRKRLGSLSQEQEINIQNFVISTVIKISEEIHVFVEQFETSKVYRLSLAATING